MSTEEEDDSVITLQPLNFGGVELRKKDEEENTSIGLSSKDDSYHLISFGSCLPIVQFSPTNILT